MSWIKRFFQRLNADKDEYIGETLHTNQRVYEETGNSHDGSWDVDTKIMYQYPKGQFRFPLIPDDEDEKVARRAPKSDPHIQVAHNQTKAGHGGRVGREKVSIKNNVKKRAPEQEKVRKPSFSNRPFQPTEIPSPIYGYERKIKKSAPIEFELDPFSPGLSEEEVQEVKRDDVLEQRPIVEDVSEEEIAIVEEEQILLHEEETSPLLISEVQSSSSDVEENVEENRVKKRAHLPFNVMMLKEDKRRLESKQRHSIPEEEVAAALPLAFTAQNEVSVTIEEEHIEASSNEEMPYYVFPPIELLKPPVFKTIDAEWLKEQEQLLNDTLFNFNVRASVVNLTQGPAVTRFEVQPEPGVKVNKITNLSDDIKLSLAAKDIRMEAPIPGTHLIGIEVPNKSSRPVCISEIITSEAFLKNRSPLTAVLGLDISGKPVVTDISKMPHGLIAGATGSGKSVCINSILVSILYKADPNEVKLLLIDPKMVELAPYNQIPHLVSPVITDVKAATAALKWAVDEMERRYELFVHAGVRDIGRFNELAMKHERYAEKLPYIVIIIDELADLMMMSPADVEEAICRIAQKARACGIHLIIATQRPSVDVITGLIKANIPTRIAFSVSSQVDSRTIIDIGGAERLLGRGDMLFLENGSSKPVRLQGTFVSDEEIDAVVAHARKEQSPHYLFEQEELLKKATAVEEDELYYEACEFIVEQGGASTSSLQRRFKIGYNRAARLIDLMEEQGFISEARGSKPRDVLITESELELIHEAGTTNE